MKKAIIYSTKYGTTKRYALEFSKKTGFEVFESNKIKSISSFDTVIFFTPIYAGTLKGFNKFIKAFSFDKIEKIIIVCVGLADPNKIKKDDKLYKSIEENIPHNLKDKYEIYNLQGELDFNKLNFFNKTMIKIVYNSQKKNGVNDSEIVKLMENENKKISFVDFDSLNYLVDKIKT